MPRDLAPSAVLPTVPTRRSHADEPLAARPPAPDGHWVGELEGDTILESEYVLLLAFLGREAEAVCVKACRYLRDLQLPDGGWAIYPGGPVEISASVKAYFALKLVGVPADDPDMVRAREAILAHGGAQGCNSFTRFYLALLGQIGYDECPTVPPETGPDPVVAEFQPGRDVVVDADDRRPADVHLGVQAGARAAARAGDRRAVPRRPAPAALAADPTPGLVDELLPRRRPRAEGGRPGHPASRGGSPASARRTAGCSTTSRTPTASGRSSRR